MELSNEDIVTGILINREILKCQESPEIFEAVNYSSSPRYDLSLYMKNAEPEKSRFGEKYVFVK